MGWYGAWIAMGLLGGGLLLLVWIAVALVVVWTARALFPGERRSDPDPALKILRRRYAAGEISQAEYEDTGRILGWDRRIEMEHDNDEIKPK
jgi:uncharacterized membrane protein